MRFISAVFVLSLLGCTSQADMDAMPASMVINSPGNYQQVYANAFRGVRNCFASTSAGTAVDGQMLPDLGYGEITVATTALSYSPFLRLKVAADGAGSRTELTTTLPGQRVPDWVRYWSGGGLSCPKLHITEQPPA